MRRALLVSVLVLAGCFVDGVDATAPTSVHRCSVTIHMTLEPDTLVTDSIIPHGCGRR